LWSGCKALLLGVELLHTEREGMTGTCCAQHRGQPTHICGDSNETCQCCCWFHPTGRLSCVRCVRCVQPAAETGQKRHTHSTCRAGTFCSKGDTRTGMHRSTPPERTVRTQTTQHLPCLTDTCPGLGLLLKYRLPPANLHNEKVSDLLPCKHTPTDRRPRRPTAVVRSVG
jgi:hypothetical protein